MQFIRKFLPSKKILLVDIGTYKVKTAICEYKEWDIILQGYGEKKQEPSYIIETEIGNLEGVMETIVYTYKKAYEKNKCTPTHVIFSIPTIHTITYAKELAYVRETPHEPITIKELDSIIKKIESQALAYAKTEITKQTGLSYVEMKLVTSSITHMTLDNYQITNPIWFSWKYFILSTLNVFIPASRYALLQGIGKKLKKNILAILPQEFCITKIIEHTEYVYDTLLSVDIGNSHTYLVFQKWGSIIKCNRIPLWMKDLIYLIREHYGDTYINIIENLHKNERYEKEKQFFLSLWKENIETFLSEIMAPNTFWMKIFLSWGSAEKPFLKECLQKIHIYVAKENNNMHPIIGFDSIKTKLPIKANMHMFSSQHATLFGMILAAKELIQETKNPISLILKHFIEKNIP